MRTVKLLVVLGVLALFAGCATPFPSNSDGATIERINFEVNRVPSCGSPRGGVCHPVWPSRAELAKVVRYECTGYVMEKAYRLARTDLPAQKGIEAERMAVAVIESSKGSMHAVLVIDGLYVLDNQAIGVRKFSEYERFNPVLQRVPWRI